MAKNTILVRTVMNFIIEHRFEDGYIFLQRNDSGDDEIHIRDSKNQHKYAILNLDNNNIQYHNTIISYEKELSKPTNFV